MFVILVFCIFEFHLALRFRKFNKNKKKHSIEKLENFPFVTIQLPVYNEKFVIERLINSVCKLSYPKDKFEIQVLDDSTDESLQIAKELVSKKVEEGINIYHITREKNVGFKAGALANGLKTAKGKFIAIFDADFIPPQDFIERTIAAFDTEEVGMVQTKWEHINANYSLLTQVQAFTLDVHFNIEHIGRNSSGYFMNFNGTAGMWRKSTIESAGGWSADTITEDLDLSYRAQLKNWKFKYLFDVGVPAELPIDINGYKSQQYRWNKGGAEVAIKLIPKILRKDIPLKQKLFALHHLLSSSMYAIIFFSGLLSVPVLYFKSYYPNWLIALSSLFLSGFVAIGFVYFLSYNQSKTKNETSSNFVFGFLSFMAFSIGMSFHNTIAVCSAYLKQKSPFIRTAKFNIKSKKDNLKKNAYLQLNVNFGLFVEACLFLYFLAAIVYGIYNKEFGLLLFHLISCFGYLLVVFYSIKQAFFIRK